MSGKPEDCFKVERYSNDRLLEANLNRMTHDGWRARKIEYDPNLDRGSWAVVFERDKPRGRG